MMKKISVIIKHKKLKHLVKQIQEQLCMQTLQHVLTLKHEQSVQHSQTFGHEQSTEHVHELVTQYTTHSTGKCTKEKKGKRQIYGNRYRVKKITTKSYLSLQLKATFKH